MEEFLKWLYDFEFVKLGLPVPDITISLDVIPETSYKLLTQRAENEEHSSDIHEADKGYLEKCYNASRYAREKWSWCVVKCCDENKNMLSRETIHEDIYKKVMENMPEKMRK